MKNNNVFKLNLSENKLNFKNSNTILKMAINWSKINKKPFINFFFFF